MFDRPLQQITPSFGPPISSNHHRDFFLTLTMIFCHSAIHMPVVVSFVSFISLAFAVFLTLSPQIIHSICVLYIWHHDLKAPVIDNPTIIFGAHPIKFASIFMSCTNLMFVSYFRSLTHSFRRPDRNIRYMVTSPRKVPLIADKAGRE